MVGVQLLVLWKQHSADRHCQKLKCTSVLVCWFAGMILVQGT
jgi:hypothetical protein